MLWYKLYFNKTVKKKDDENFVFLKQDKGSYEYVILISMPAMPFKSLSFFLFIMPLS